MTNLTPIVLLFVASLRFLTPQSLFSKENPFSSESIATRKERSGPHKVSAVNCATKRGVEQNSPTIAVLVLVTCLAYFQLDGDLAGSLFGPCSETASL